jgi:hypothetical protein
LTQIDTDTSFVTRGPRTRARWSILNALIVLQGILVVLLRPSAFGEVYSVYLVATLSVVLVVYFAVSGKLKLSLDQIFMLQSAIVAYLILYANFRDAVSGSLDFDVVLKGIAIDFVAFASIFFAVANRDARKLFFDSMAIVIIAVCFGVIVSFVLQIILGSVNDMIIAKIEYTYARRGDVAFPFTFIFNKVRFGSIFIARMSGIFREPGIVPALACWAAGYAFFRGWGWTPIWIAFLGGIFSLSSMGISLAAICLPLLLAYRLRVSLIGLAIVMGLVAVIGWEFVYTLDGIGIGDKISSGSGSFEARYFIFESAFGGSNYLLGDGKGWSGVNTETINMFGDIRVYGLVYFALMIVVWMGGLRRPRYWLVAIMPSFLTCLFTQPISTTPIMLAIALSWTVFAGQENATSEADVLASSGQE